VGQVGLRWGKGTVGLMWEAEWTQVGKSNHDSGLGQVKVRWDEELWDPCMGQVGLRWDEVL
jgi:hypothetical protein